MWKGKRATPNAGKERRTKHRNDKRDGSSSAAPASPPVAPSSVYDPILFLCSDTYNLYMSKFINRKIAEGKIVLPSICKSLNLNTFSLFDAIGWGSVVSLRCLTYPSLIRMFYSNLSKSSGEIKSYVNGRTIFITVASLRDTLGLIEGDIKSYSSYSCVFSPDYDAHTAIEELCINSENVSPRGFYAKDLIVPARILHNVITYNIMPKSGSRNDVTYFELYIIWCLVHGVKLDLAHIIFNHIYDCYKKPRGSLFYGMILTKIFIAHNVPFDGHSAQQPLATSKLDSATLKLMKLAMREDGSWYDPQAEKVQDDDEMDENEENETEEGEDKADEENEEEDNADYDPPSQAAAAPSFDESSPFMQTIISKMDEQLSVSRETQKMVMGLQGRLDIMQERIDTLDANVAAFRNMFD